MQIVHLIVRFCVCVQYICFAIIEWFNTASWFPFFTGTPLPYAVGTCAEDIRHIFLASDIMKKRPVIVRLRTINGLLRFQIAAPALFTIHDQKSKNSSLVPFDHQIYRIMASVYINLIFLFSRCTYLVLRSLILWCSFKESNKDYAAINRLLDSLSFPRVGLLASVEIIYKELLKYPKSKYVMYNKMRERTYAFAPQYIKSWQKYLHQIGLKSFKRLIVIHTRTSNYHNDSGRRNYRNATTSNYLPLIEYLSRSGYTIALIGGNCCDEVPRGKNIHDLRHGVNGKPCSLDIYLVQKCFFYIGMMSGPLDLAILFARQTLILNAYLAQYCFGYPAETLYVLQTHVHASDVTIKGIRSLIKKNIQLLKIDDLVTRDYELRELLPMQILKFCLGAINRKDDYWWRNNHEFVDVTYSCNQEQFKAFSDAVDTDSSMDLSRRFNALRFMVNALLSRDWVRIFEV